MVARTGLALKTMSSLRGPDAYETGATRASTATATSTTTACGMAAPRPSITPDDCANLSTPDGLKLEEHDYSASSLRPHRPPEHAHHLRRGGSESRPTGRRRSSAR